MSSFATSGDRYVELSGGRELVNEERAKELLASITEINPTQIRLSNKSFDNGAAAVIADYLSQLTDLQVADISDIIAGRPEDEALRTMAIISSSLKKFPLIELNVSDNAMGAKGIEACRELFSNQHLQRLFVCNDGLSAEACQLLASILLSGDDSNSTVPKLTLLHCYNNMAGDGGAEAFGSIISSCPTIENFRFSATRSMKAGCMFIATALNSLINLRRLDLSDNNFSEATGEQLIKSLVGKASIEYLNLRDDALGSENVLLLIDSIKATAASTLTHLDISGNDLEPDVIEDFAAALQEYKQLTYLALDDNEVGAQGSRHIAAAVKNLKKLKTLSCCTCEITACGGYFLAKAVSKLPEFVNLELNGNQFTEAGVEAIEGVISEAGKVLGDLDDNDEDADDDLEEALAYFESSVDGDDADELAAALEKTNI